MLEETSGGHLVMLKRHLEQVAQDYVQVALENL